MSKDNGSVRNERGNACHGVDAAKYDCLGDRRVAGLFGGSSKAGGVGWCWEEGCCQLILRYSKCSGIFVGKGVVRTMKIVL